MYKCTYGTFGNLDKSGKLIAHRTNQEKTKKKNNTIFKLQKQKKKKKLHPLST